MDLNQISFELSTLIDLVQFELLPMKLIDPQMTPQITNDCKMIISWCEIFKRMLSLELIVSLLVLN